MSLTKVGETRISRTVYDYVFRVTLHNNAAALAAVTATVTAAGQGTTIVDGDALVGDMAAGATITASDTITLRQDRTFPFNPAALVWRLRSVLAVPALVPGATLAYAPAGRATVGSPFEASLRLTPADTRNAIISLGVSNPTPGGASPAISLAGLLSWAPNEADFATTMLRITAGLQDGSSSSFDVPVTVTKYRLVANVALNGAGRYSDPDGRYLVNVSGATPGASVIGTLSISERYQVSGAFSNEITSSDASHVIEVINAPLGVPFGAEGATSSQSSRQRALASADGRRRPTAAQFSAYAESIWGAKVDAGINLHTTRQGIAAYDNVEVARIEANCRLPTCDDARLSSATPVILIHGYLPEKFLFWGGLNGGTGTWGSLGAKLDNLGHPVYELRWLTTMRFDEAAGLLVKLAQRVSDATGRKPFIIAHSFGGVVAHLALAGQAITWRDDTKNWEKLPAGKAEEPLFDGLVTLASPLSGINDDGFRTDFVKGRHSGDKFINFCGQVSCVQAAAFDMIEVSWLQRNVGAVKSKSGARPASGSDSDLKTGEAIEAIRNAWDGAKIALPASKIHTVIALRERPLDDYTPDLNTAYAFFLGDGLISMIGQAVLPKDFTCNSTIIDPHLYNFAGCLEPSIHNFLKTIDTAPLEGSATPFVTANLGGRNYYFASRAAHSLAQIGLSAVLEDGFNIYETTPYLIANYEESVVVGEDRWGHEYYASHPLRFFIDNVLKRSDATPAPPPSYTATVKGVVTIDGKGIDLRTVPAWRTIIRAEGESPVSSKKTIPLDAAGNFSFDAAAWLREELGPRVVASDYRIRAEFGDGIVVEMNTRATDRLKNSTATYDLGVIGLTTVVTGMPLVSIAGSVKAAGSMDPIAAADVWLARGGNMAPAEVRGWPDSNVARHVTSNAAGTFSVAGLRPGDYTVLVSHSGFSDVLLGMISVAEGRVIEIVMLPSAGATRLNDTGVTVNQCYASGSSSWASCLSSSAKALNNRQDGMVGLDVSAPDNSDGKLGFSYTKIDASGNELPNSAPSWTCVRDNISGLMWEIKTKDGGLRDSSKKYTNKGDYSPTDASTFVRAVNDTGLCGFKDWRLPAPNELIGLVDYGSGNFIDTSFFKDSPKGYHWSLDTYLYVPDLSLTWVINFSNGAPGALNKSDLAPIRLARGPRAAGSGKYAFSPDGSEVTDISTGLIWRRCAEGQTWTGLGCDGVPAKFTHEQALAYAAAQADWRMPNVKEMRSIIDTKKVNPAVDAVAFPMPLDVFPTWTATPLNYSSGWVFSVNMIDGGGGHTPRSNLGYLRLVK